ncbi:hypothetical protein PV325_001230 [Microctonus aethiopoides]|nr:hypothetical protein PV325_001230 [Microctonus aethiopoides]
MSDKLNEIINIFLNLICSDYCDAAFQTNGLTDVAGSSNGPIPIKPALMPSILIQSLIQQLGSMFVRNPRTREQLYAILCDALYQHQFIDDSYTSVEFDATRKLFRDLFDKLINNLNSETLIHTSIPSSSMDDEKVIELSPDQLSDRDEVLDRQLAGAFVGISFRNDSSSVNRSIPPPSMDDRKEHPNYMDCYLPSANEVEHISKTKSQGVLHPLVTNSNKDQ